MIRSSVARHIARRLVLLLPTLLGLSLLAFGLLRLVPGDPAEVMLGEHATPGQVARFRQEMGLDQPLPVQYARYLAHLLRGDWGRSIKTGLPVRTELGRRLPATVELGAAAMLIACAVGIPLGILAAYRPRSPAAVLASEGTLLGVSIPLFWLGLLLAHLFGYRLGWLPPSGRLGVEVPMASLAQVYGLAGTWLAGPADLLVTPGATGRAVFEHQPLLTLVEADPDVALAALKPYQGHVYHTSLATDAEQNLRDILSKRI